jgi:hypothetical protein
MNNEPVAWGMTWVDGEIYDVISPKQHEILEGDYTIPLYTHPAKTLTDEEIIGCAQDVKYSELSIAVNDFYILFARAILKKAIEK